MQNLQFVTFASFSDIHTSTRTHAHTHTHILRHFLFQISRKTLQRKAEETWNKQMHKLINCSITT